jgi:hypothetical protein
LVCRLPCPAIFLPGLSVCVEGAILTKGRIPALLKFSTAASEAVRPGIFTPGRIPVRALQNKLARFTEGVSRSRQRRKMNRLLDETHGIVLET